jgi:hypothetical protein
MVFVNSDYCENEIMEILLGLENGQCGRTSLHIWSQMYCVLKKSI